jgi:hypothetical protein
MLQWRVGDAMDMSAKHGRVDIGDSYRHIFVKYF